MGRRSQPALRSATPPGPCQFSPPPLQPQTFPYWNLPENELHELIGPGEEAHAVPWTELNPTQQEFQALKMAIHAAMVDRMDREIGRVLDQLREMNAMENTLILFASDNGASAEQIIRGDNHDPRAPAGSADTYLCLGPGWSSASNTPFRLHKSWNNEGGVASPLIVYWPAGIGARGELRHNPGHFVDILPTLVDLAGAQPAPHWNESTPPPLPGHSLAPAFERDGAALPGPIYFSHQGNRALRVGDWKIVAEVDMGGRMIYWTESDESSGIPRPHGFWELYNMRSDRAELLNLASHYPEKLAEMTARWDELNEQFRTDSGLER